MNFATFERSRFSYKMLPPGKVTVPGFCDDDTHQDVIDKAVKGLDIDSAKATFLIMSNGLVNTPLSNGKPWALGKFVTELGGAQVRGKRTFGICVVDSDEESDGMDEEVKNYLA